MASTNSFPLPFPPLSLHCLSPQPFIHKCWLLFTWSTQDVSQYSLPCRMDSDRPAQQSRLNPSALKQRHLKAQCNIDVRNNVAERWLWIFYGAMHSPRHTHAHILTHIHHTWLWVLWNAGREQKLSMLKTKGSGVGRLILKSSVIAEDTRLFCSFFTPFSPFCFAYDHEALFSVPRPSRPSKVDLISLCCCFFKYNT